MENQNSLLIERLIKEMQFRNYSPRSVHSYSTVLTKLEKKIGIPLEQITISQLKDYLHCEFIDKKHSTSIINQCISAYKILQVDILGREWEPVRLKRPRVEKRLPLILSQSEVESLISATKNLKHKALLMLAYSSGMRRMEIQNILPSAIDSARMQVHVVQGKGKKDRYTILSKKALEALRNYYRKERPRHYLFESSMRKGLPLSDRTLEQIVKKNLVKAGIKKDVSFHTLRHCFATHLLEQGVNLRVIQQFMGHNSIKTTSAYLHLANISPGSVVSPLDSMNV
jgi:site-specific recombinase XerD